MFDTFKGKSLVQMKIHANEQAAEIDRLRAALDRIAFCGAGEDYRRLREIALKTLQPL